MEVRPRLPASILFAIAFLAMDAAGLTLVVGRLSAEFSATPPESVVWWIAFGGMAAWVLAAAGCIAGLLGRRRSAWLAAFWLTAASTALLLLPVAVEGLPSGRALPVLAFLLANLLVPLALLLAGRRAYRQATERPASRP